MNKLRIKRHKQGNTAYVVAILPNGSIASLTSDVRQASLFTVDQAGLVKAYYADRDGFGLLSFEDENSRPAEPTSEVVVLRKQRDSLVDELNELADERDLLLSLIGQPPDGSAPEESRPRGKNWHEERALWQGEVAALRTRIAVLEEAAAKPQNETPKAKK